MSYAIAFRKLGLKNMQILMMISSERAVDDKKAKNVKEKGMKKAEGSIMFKPLS